MKLIVSVWLFSLTFHLNDMFKLSVVRHFFSSDNYATSNILLTMKQLLHWFMLLSAIDLITVTACYLEHQRSWLMSCRMFRMQLLYMVRRRSSLSTRTVHPGIKWHTSNAFEISTLWWPHCPSCKPVETWSTIVCQRRTTYMELITSATQGLFR